ncbi:MAG: lipoprotein signal peptidase [Bacteroidota bacterium]
MWSHYKYFLVTLLIIVIDQAIKMAVHTYMQPGFIGQISIIGDFFKLHYVTNPGMAFGITLDFANGKLILTIFRIIAMIGIGFYLLKMAKSGASSGFLLCISLILGGAIGNVIDSIFYGKYLGNAPFGTENPWFHGQVIDMFFFDFWEGMIPNWVPIWGGSWYSTPIFNFADASIFVGVVSILIFQKRFFSESKKEEVDLINSELDS